LFSRLLIPKRGLLWVTFDTTTFGVHRRQIEFRSTILRQGSPTITLYCHGKILVDADASVYQEPDLESGFRIHVASATQTSIHCLAVTSADEECED
jgi:hypothetical protein